MKNKLFISALLGILLYLPAKAEVKLSSLLSDHMVLKRNSVVSLWGEGEPNKKVRISPSWTKKTFSVLVDTNGKWIADIPTTEAGGPYSISFEQGNRITINDVLLGEVWLCSGQSNMEMPVKGFSSQPVEGSFDHILNADSEIPVRLFKMEKRPSLLPSDSIFASWQTLSPQSVADFSAVGYFFAMQLYRSLHIPIGMIQSAWSASNIQTWISEDYLKAIPSVDLTHLQKENVNDISTVYHKGALLYNGMIHPLCNYAINGVIWYQGESNTYNPEEYIQLSASWMKNWRELFHTPELPFYITQIAPFNTTREALISWPQFRDAQWKIKSSDSHCEMILTSDIGHSTCIHPPKKKEVGERLAASALANTYGVRGLPKSYPSIQKWEKKGNKYVIYFDAADSGLIPEFGRVEGLEFLTQSGELMPANSFIPRSKNCIEVWNDSLTNPKEIRYLYKNFQEGNLKTTLGLPVAPFRVIIE